MRDRTAQQQIVRYYSRLGSRLGYLLVMRRSQHFGYYDKRHRSETAAQEKYHEEFAKLLKLQIGMKVLDAGCGQGVVACYLARACDVEVTGITITPHEVKSAQKRARKLGVSAAKFELADYANAPFPDEYFDRIYTTETLSHATDVEKVLREFNRMLKPDGTLVCAEYEMDHQNFDSRAKEMADFVKHHAAIHGIYQFGKGQFVSSLKRAGFTLKQEVDWTAHVKPSFDRLRKLARPTAAIAKIGRLEKYFVNSVAASLYSNGVEDGVFAYKVYVAKPKVIRR